MTCGIYLIKHKASGLLYVGQARNIEARWTRHLKLDTNRYLKSLLMEEGEEALEFSVLEEVGAGELNQREQFWIRHLGTLYPSGFNLTTGGKVPESTSAEVRIILSSAQKNVWKNPERRLRQSAAGKARLSKTAVRLSTVHSPAARLKISESMKARSAAMNQLRWGRQHDQ